MIAALLPVAIAATLLLSLPLPLQWWTLGGSAVITAVLAGVTLLVARTHRSTLAAAAAISLTITIVFVLGYAAYALRRPGAFGPVSRLGYPFLVGTGLRLQGGAWLVGLCGVVAVVPIVFRERSG
jgi:hypothetical protein